MMSTVRAVALTWALTTARSVCAFPHREAKQILLDAQAVIEAAKFGMMATHAIGGNISNGGVFDINTRVVEIKPLEQIKDLHSLNEVYIDTNSWSRKYDEIATAERVAGAARMSLMYFDSNSSGYVSLRGSATICSHKEAQELWWDGWNQFFPQGKETAYYSLIRFRPDWLEISGGPRQPLASNRADWMPVSLERPCHQCAWRVAVFPEPAAISREGASEDQLSAAAVESGSQPAELAKAAELTPSLRSSPIIIRA